MTRRLRRSAGGWCAGRGPAKSDHRYARARARINGANDGQAEHWLLARRSLADPTDPACYICHTPPRVSLAELVRVAGARWAVEETFQTAKGGQAEAGSTTTKCGNGPAGAGTSPSPWSPTPS